MWLSNQLVIPIWQRFQEQNHKIIIYEPQYIKNLDKIIQIQNVTDNLLAHRLKNPQLQYALNVLNIFQTGPNLQNASEPSRLRSRVNNVGT